MNSVKKCLPIWLLIPLLGGGCGEPINIGSGDRVEVSVEGAPVYGNKDAPVVVVEFVDIQCPYCSVSARRMKNLAEARPNDVQLVFRHFPLTAIHSRALSAAIVAECAEDQGKFWEVLDALVAPDADLSDPAMDKTAQGLGLNMDALHQCIVSREAVSRVNQDLALGDALEIHATPTTFINGLRVVGLQSPMSLEMTVNRELERLKQEKDAFNEEAEANDPKAKEATDLPNGG